MCKNSVETKRLARSYYSSMAFASSIKNPRKVLLTGVISLTIQRRTMFKITSEAINIGKNQISNVVKFSTTYARTFKTTAGRIKEPSLIPKTMPGNDDTPVPIQSDVSGKHISAALSFCKDQNQCHNRQCDTKHLDTCPHAKGDPMLISELAGALTHKVPAGKEGVTLCETDIKGKSEPQHLVKEKVAVPLDMKNFKENDTASEYLQKDVIWDKLRANSGLSLKNTSFNDSPVDKDDI